MTRNFTYTSQTFLNKRKGEKRKNLPSNFQGNIKITASRREK